MRLYRFYGEKKRRASGYHGFIKGGASATCFTEMSLSSVSKLFEQSKCTKHPYEFYSLAIHKGDAFSQAARLVIYLPNEEATWLPTEEKRRYVRSEYGSVDFPHEREWRNPNDFVLNRGFGYYVIVRSLECENHIISLGLKYKRYWVLFIWKH